jgi:CHAD domain-containing protein
VKARSIEGLNPEGPLRPSIARIVAVRLEELRGLVNTALVADASEAQHDMRIAAKRLRYVLEIFAPCLGEEAEAARGAAKRLQSTLGNLHDCDLMLTKVERIDSVAVLLGERRSRLFHEFAELWRSETSKGTWATLERGL